MSHPEPTTLRQTPRVPAGLPLRSLVLALAPVIILLLVPSLARAAQAHAYSESFGSAGSGAGQLSLAEAGGIAVDNTTGDVYVADSGNNRVDEFSSTGTFLRAWGWGVDDGKAELEVCTVLCQAGIAGNGPGQFDSPAFIAVDNSPGGEGDVYVANSRKDSSQNRVLKFSSEGDLINSWGTGGQITGGNPPGGPFGLLEGLAVGPSGNLWVYVGGTEELKGNHMYEFGQEGAYELSWTPGDSGGYSRGLAVDASNDLYIFQNSFLVQKSDSSGAFLGGLYATPAQGLENVRPATLSGLALDGASQEVLVDERSSILTNRSNILAFSPQCDLVAVPEPDSSFCLPAQTFGASFLGAAADLAVNGDTGQVFATNGEKDQIAVFTVSLEAGSSPAIEVKATTAILHGQVDPEGAALETCVFEYGTTANYGQEVPCEETPAQIGSGTADVAVHAAINGLEGGARYHFRLRAISTRPGTEGNEVVSDDETLDTLPIAAITGVSASNLTPTSATLGASVDPRGLEVQACSFEYDTRPYGAEEAPHGTAVPCQPTGLGAGTAPIPVSAAIGGLTAGTTYHFRVDVTDANGAAITPDNTFIYLPPPPHEACPQNEAFRTGLSADLPECRVYEQVTPNTVNGATLNDLFNANSPALSSDGSRMIALTTQCFGGAASCTANRAHDGQPVEFLRTPTGWMATPLSPPVSTLSASSPWKFDVESGSALFSGPDPAEPGPEQFVIQKSDGSSERVGPVGDILSGWSGQTRSKLYSGSGAESRTVWTTQPAYWSFDDTEVGTSVYEFAGTGNRRPLLVGVEGGPGSTQLVSPCGTALAGNELATAMSRDGTSIYFEAQPGHNGCIAPGLAARELLVRADGEGAGAHTVAISEPTTGPTGDCSECDDSNPAPPEFQGASDDGSKAFFSTTQELLPGNPGGGLYEYDFDSPNPHRRVTAISAGPHGQAADLQGVMAVSPDGSHVYFVAGGVLTESPNAQGESPRRGKNNLYLYESDAEHPDGQLQFVTLLAGADKTPATYGGGAWGEPGGGEANVSGNGRFLVFLSHRALTPDDTREEGPAQVYRYDAASGALQRLSIGRRAFNDDGNASLGDGEIAPANIALEGGRRGPMEMSPTMSRDASVVFFTSPAALTPGALDDVAVTRNSNGPVYAQNVYEWSQQGVGACSEPTGCISLISDGRDTGLTARHGGSASAVELIGTDETGQNVIFTTSDPLLPSDTDSAVDFYDARIGGGIAEPPSPVPCQTGEACHPGTTAGGQQSSPATPNFNGPSEGPDNAEKCKKGLVRKGARCVKPSKHHGKKGKHKIGKHKKSRKRGAAHKRGGGK